MSDSGKAEQAAPAEAAAPASGSSPWQASPEPTTGILPAQHWTAQQIDLEDADGADSTLGSDAASSTASITSTILQYRTIQGRTYHSERGNAQYWASNDEKQNDAMDIIHHVLTLCAGGKLFLAPVPKDIKKVLDIGTGTGIWAIDFADEYPDAEVVGTDISPIQPSWVPPNLKFEIEDCTSPWTFPADSVDFVHIRWLVGSIPDWTELFKQAYKVCRPGGYVESFEPGVHIESEDGTVTETDAMGQWGKLFVEGGKIIGRSFTVVEDSLQRKAMEEAGFVDIQEKNFKTPLGSWPKDPTEKEIGMYEQLVIEKDAEGYILFLANTIGWTREELLVYIAHVRREVRSHNHHGFYWQRAVWGRKPERSFQHDVPTLPRGGEVFKTSTICRPYLINEILIE